MIYIARLVFLLGSCCTTAGVILLALKIMYEPVLPEVMQGQWAMLFVCIAFSVLYTMVGQYLGSDIVGVGAKVNEAVENEYKHYRRQDGFTQAMYWKVIADIFRSIRN